MTFDPAAAKTTDISSAMMPRYIATADTIITNTAAETSMFSASFAGSGLNIPTNRLAVGTTIRIVGQALYTTPTVAGTATVKVKLGGTTLSTSLANALVGSAANNAADMNVTITCRSTGTAGSIAITGGYNFATTGGARVYVDCFNAGSNITVNTTVANTLDVTCTWSAADPARTLLVRSAYVSLLN